MALDINGLTQGSNSSNKAKGAGSANVGGSKNNAPTTDAVENSSQGTTDSVELSQQVQNLQVLENKINQLPDVNATRVAEIKDALANGTYEIEPERIAKKLLAFELGLK